MDRSDVALFEDLLQEKVARRPWLRWGGLAAVLALAVVAWEYLLNAVTNPVDWNPAGVAAHMAMDWRLVLAVVALALTAGLGLARRFHMGTAEWAGVLGDRRPGLPALPGRHAKHLERRHARIERAEKLRKARAAGEAQG
jgi:hypothetical protein